MEQRVLDGVELHESVVVALRTAGSRVPRRPVDTRDLLVALMRADTAGAWDRVWLHCGDPDGIAGKVVLDAANGSSASWEDVPLTDSCATALDIAGRLAHRYNLRPLPVGVLALALVADESSAAARALDGLERAELLRLLQSDVLGLPLGGIETTLPRLVAEARRPHHAQRQAPVRNSFSPAPQRVWYCTHCGGTPAVPVTIYGHRGLVLWMRFLRRSGPFCRDCGLAIYRQMTLENVWRGWWGPFSVFINAVTMLFNLLTYRDITKLPPPIPGMPGRPMSPGKPLFRRPVAFGFLIPAVLSVSATALVVTSGVLDEIGRERAPTASAEVLASDAALGDGCARQRTYFTRADAYAGSGPHPVAVFRNDEMGNVDPVDKSKWDSQRARQWMGVDAERYQLIVCLGSARDGERLGHCTFQSRTIPLHRGIYDATVYEARTGAKVGSAQLRGSSRTDGCPYFVVLPAGASLHTEPDLAEIQRALGKYVDRAMPGKAAPATKDLTGLCHALSTRMPDREQLGPMGPVTRPTDTPVQQSCNWSTGARFVTVDVKAHAGYGGAGSQAADAARMHFQTATTMMRDPQYGAGAQNMPGLGEQAAVTQSRQYSNPGATVAVLSGDVTVEVTWTGRGLPYGAARDQAVTVARTALGLAGK
ncbi:hypothetical protein [Nocardia wallacei]|uniref:hypothetical protein n=1 Tax=Nocardia wallacei TaxID=480035 RepID=UPI0024562368|nr:hypothetical protein [Nocardia wallacei]